MSGRLSNAWQDALERIRKSSKNPLFMPTALLAAIEYFEETQHKGDELLRVPFLEIDRRFKLAAHLSPRDQNRSNLPFYWLSKGARVWSLLDGARGVDFDFPVPGETPSKPQLIKTDVHARFNDDLLPELLQNASRSDIKARLKVLLQAVPMALPGLVTPDEEYPEGREKFWLHRRKERNQRAIKRKKEMVLLHSGKLLCEVCDFDFSSAYGELGEGFAECHHRTPLADLHAETRTRLKGLAIVCANCHRMLHRRSGVTVEELRSLVNELRIRKSPRDDA